ncbi:MAG TPA: hypothetical protein VI110_01320, partial [Lapillicoccus sp.]
LVVPGHGRPVDVAFVGCQRDELAAVAAVIRDRHAAGIPLLQAQQEPDGRLPYPLDGLADAFTRGYGQLSGDLPRSRPGRAAADQLSASPQTA